MHHPGWLFGATPFYLEEGDGHEKMHFLDRPCQGFQWRTCRVISIVQKKRIQ
jgi:hypothetical protein